MYQFIFTMLGSKILDPVSWLGIQSFQRPDVHSVLRLDNAMNVVALLQNFVNTTEKISLL